ncbi:hypothetical protein NIES2101_13180 [Calothrix sp. HK-06]|nr:hypothetical protein NIES2101_13180 [Calothrix sp. HK-06]
MQPLANPDKNCTISTPLKIAEESYQRANQVIEWLRDYAPRRINTRLIDERRCITPHIVLDFGKQGLLGMIVPETYGGINLTYRDMLRVIEQIAAIDINLATFVGLNNVLGIFPILKYGNEQTKETYLKPLAQGRDLAAFAITEAHAGSNPRAIKTVAKPNKNGGWLLSGNKIWIGSASWASVINVFAYIKDEQGKCQGMTAFSIPENARGLRQGPEALTMGMRGMVQNAVYLQEVPVNHNQVLGQIGAGFEVAQDAMQLGRLGIAAICLGGMKRCAQLMFRYAVRRSIALDKLLYKSITLERFSDLTAAIGAIECFLESIATWLDEKLPLPQEVYLAAKIIAPELMWQTADNFIQLLGGRGYIESNNAPQILRDVRLLRIFEGPTETLQMHLGMRAWYQPSELYSFINEKLEASEISAQIKRAVDFCNTYVRKKNPSPTEKPVLIQPLSKNLGDLTAWALILACIRKFYQSKPTIELARVEKWLQQRLELKLAIALEELPDHQTLLKANQVEYLVSNYSESIGDIELMIAGEDTELDPYIFGENSEI